MTSNQTLDEARLQQPVFRHPETRWADVEAFHAASVREDGIHVIGSGAARQIEILTGGSPFESIDEPVLVIFSGAISDRETKTPPFFSGSGLAASTGHAFIAISDPGIELSGQIAIAWYAGSAHHDTRSALIELLSPLSVRLGTDLWLVGGSAGGFSALAMGHALPGGPSVFTWNPQTDILEYSRRFVVDYLTTAFPVSAQELGGPDYKDVGREVLRRHGVVSSHLDSLPSQGPGRLFYLQNATDVHFLDHCRPYLRSQGYTRYDRGVWRRDRDKVIWIADVAPGHTPPSRDQLVYLLHRLTHSADDVLTTVRHLDAADYFRDDPVRRPEPLAVVAEEISRRVTVDWDGAELHVQSDLPDGVGHLTWTAELVSNGRPVEASGPQTAWGSWAPSSRAKADELVVELLDGFGDEVLTRRVAL
ncbi:hypothetical protein V1260_07985 [Brachybacterium sp. J144]|uniref:hypothetical protein n=1 Tax=Brachybacterium sp. J144 TaxID=3116487 RepID=UPI002E77C149|nr:hypothetical protein [Brachybacterium sp. J144]MEE1650731.1 hypothetical protein [Brachybacterium sp. J144]